MLKSYSRRSFTQNVWELTFSGLTIFPEFRYLNSKEHNDGKKSLAHKVWYIIRDVRYAKK
jgi:hypothetical protein